MEMQVYREWITSIRDSGTVDAGLNRFVAACGYLNIIGRSITLQVCQEDESIPFGASCTHHLSLPQ